MRAPDSPVGTLRYFVSHNSELKGPFDLDMIEAFILSGHYPRGVRICAVGSKEWRSYLPPIPTSPAPASGQSGQSPVVKAAGGTLKWIFIVGGVFALVGLVVVLNGTTSGTSTGSSPTGSATHSYAVPPRYESRSAATPADVLSSFRRFSPQKHAFACEALIWDTRAMLRPLSSRVGAKASSGPASSVSLCATSPINRSQAG